MVRLEGVQEFIAVAEAGSFTAGAHRLRIAKSSISARVAALEARLGVRLLHRTTRKVCLTEAGTVYFDRCTRLLAEAGAAEQAMTQFSDRAYGRLRVSCTEDFASDHLAPLLSAFCEQFPDIVVDLHVTDLFVDLIAEEIDVAIRFGPLDNPNLVVRRLGKLWGFACAAPSYVARHGMPRHPGDLARHHCLMFTPYPWGTEWRFVNPAGERRRVRVKERAWISSGAVLRSITVAGAGISLLATPLAGACLRDGCLVDVLPGWQPDTDEVVERMICAVYPANRQIPQKVRVFVDFIAERVGDPPYWDAGLPGPD